MLVRLFLLFLALVGEVGLSADELSLVRVGEAWKYYRGTNAPSNPSTAWQGLAFDDSTWSSGISGFSTSFVADYREPTLFLDAANYRSIFLRRKFTVNDASLVKWLVLRVDYDDGFVAYLNGHEILRRGLTNATVQFDDYAAAHPGGAAEEFDLTTATGLLTNGQNLLAIEVHTAVTNEPGNPNSMRLVPELLANFQRGPFLQNPTTNSVLVIWRTPVAADSVVEFGTNQNLGSQISDSTPTTNHVVALTNLQSDVQYFYRVRSTGGGQTAVSPISPLRTLKPDGDFSFLVLADSGNGSAAQYWVAAAMAQEGGDLVMHCGDVVYPDFTYGLEDTRCLSVYGSQMRSVPFYFVMGNHEVQNGMQGLPYLATFQLPTNSVFGTEHFYSFDHGSAHFVGLYEPFLLPLSEMEPYRLYEGSAQYNWLTNDLASSSKPWKFLFLHHPLATSGSHREDHYNGTAAYDWQVLQDLLVPVAHRYGAQVIFSGHDHDYERFNPMHGVQHIVCGIGGGDINGMQETRDAASSQFFPVPGFTKVTVVGDTLFLRTMGTTGVFDSMTLQRAVPPPKLYSAAWHTPLVETESANDRHGNISGQTFDFVGDGIPALAGDFANLGRVFVNNDSTNLFIGFDQPMFYSNHNVFVFLETPGQSGVSNLVGLGNGIADTDEGVDGLDFLENLFFTNFTPSVACVLGDEYGDDQFRNFTRPGLPLNLGQGVFRLNSGFTNVNGVRIQQFNRSPQVLAASEAAFPERNANYIEVAIPFGELGGLRPGDTIRLAAVVGLSGYDTNTQSRELDTGFLGTSMAGSGQTNVVLGAVSVHLAPTLLTVKANDVVREYGATNPPLTVSCTGFVNGEDTNVLSGSPVLTTAAGTNSPVGVYPIEVSVGTLSNVHYGFFCTNGTLTVMPVALSVSADNQMRIYGATNPVFTGTLDGIRNHDQISVAYDTEATPSSPIGTYSIVPAPMGAGLDNYAVATNQGTLTITPASLSATAHNQTRLYGTTNPVLTGTILGIQNNDAITADYTTPATPASPIGLYNIVPALSGPMLTNYTFSLSNGTLTVTMAPLTAKADDQTRGYGVTNAPLTVSYSGFGIGQDTNILQGALVLTTAANTNSPVAVYAISLTQGTLSVTDTNYNLVLLDGTLNVTQALLRVTAQDQTRVYGSTNAPLSFVYSGFVNGHGTNILSGQPQLSTVAATNSAVGTYPIVVQQDTLLVADTNYGLALVNGVITVTQAMLSVTADNRTRSYGATNPEFSGSIVGIVNNDNISSTYDTEATPSSPIGTYSIVPAPMGAGLDNYAVATNQGTLTITPASLSATAHNQTRLYGTTNPVLTGTILGIQNNDAITADYTTPATPASPIGLYNIVPALSGPMLTNYTFSLSNGTLTVTMAPLTAKADDQTRGYGVTNAPLTVSYSGFGIGQDTNILQGALVLTTAANTNSPVAAYAISLTQGTLSVTDTNYNLVLLDGTLNVTQALLRVTAQDQTRVYGSTNAPLSFVYSGFVNGHGTNILSGQPQLSTVAATNSAVGTYPIVVQQDTLLVADTNYGLALIDGLLTITRALSSTFLLSSQNPTTNGDTVSFTATVTVIGPSTAIPDGNISILTNGVVLGTAPLSGGVASLSTAFFTPGTNVVEADYVGTGNFLGSTNTLEQVVVGLCTSTNYILNIVKNDTNTFTITFVGTTNAQFYLLESTDVFLPLTNWTILPNSTNTAINGIWSHTLTNEGVSRFFRAQSVLPCP